MPMKNLILPLQQTQLYFQINSLQQHCNFLPLDVPIPCLFLQFVISFPFSFWQQHILHHRIVNQVLLLNSLLKTKYSRMRHRQRPDRDNIQYEKVFIEAITFPPFNWWTYTLYEQNLLQQIIEYMFCVCQKLIFFFYHRMSGERFVLILQIQPFFEFVDFHIKLNRNCLTFRIYRTTIHNLNLCRFDTLLSAVWFPQFFIFWKVFAFRIQLVCNLPASCQHWTLWTHHWSWNSLFSSQDWSTSLRHLLLFFCSSRCLACSYVCWTSCRSFPSFALSLCWNVSATIVFDDIIISWVSVRDNYQLILQVVLLKINHFF